MSEDYPARLYAAVHRGNPGDLEFYRRRCEGARSILELGCGDARVLAALAAPGRQLVGVDLHPGLLELADETRRGQIEATGATLQLVLGDMSTLELEELPSGGFDRVLIPYGGLYCLLDQAALRATLARAAALLVPGGRLICDAWAADAFHAEAEPEDVSPDWLDRVGTIELGGRTFEVLERSTWDKAAQRLDVTYLHVEVGSTEAIPGVLRQRYVLASQLRTLLEEAGLGEIELFGDFEETRYGPDSSLLVGLARRA